jgi:hypothetical protein
LGATGGWLAFALEVCFFEAMAFGAFAAGAFRAVVVFCCLEAYSVSEGTLILSLCV